MEDLLAAGNDPDSSLPSLFPYDSFPIPKGLYTESDSSQSSVVFKARETEEEQSRIEKAVSTPRAKILVGQDLDDTVRRPSGGLGGLAPALPVSPTRSIPSLSSSSPATSPSRSRRANTADLRKLAQKHRTFRQASDDNTSSQRASRSTLASFTSTGESVYEDAVEPESDGAEEVLLELDQSQTLVLSPLDHDQFPDTPPDFEVPGRESRSRQITPKPNYQPQFVSTLLDSPIPLSPDAISSLDERTLYEQRQAELRAEVKRRPSARASISSLPTSPLGLVPTSFRRHSGIAPRAAGSTSHPRRLSLSSATSPPVSGMRHWHPKPLVLTPARTVSTPLTAESNFPSSPQRRLSTYETSLDGHLRTHSRASSHYDGTVRSVSPLSPGGYSPSGRSVSPFQSSPRRSSKIGGHVKRRSLGYVDSSNEPLSSFGHRVIGYEHRGRSASEDTGTTRTTVDSVLTRCSTNGESPESSLGGWSDEIKTSRQPSPLLDEKDWERQWQQNGSSGTPLEMVAEVSSGDIKPIDFVEEDEDFEGPSRQGSVARVAPTVRRRAATDDRPSFASNSSRSGSFVDSSLATVKVPSFLRRDSIPPTPPPKLPLPRTPSVQQASTPVPERSRPRYDERWNRELSVQDRGSSISSVGDEESDVPSSPKKPALDNGPDSQPTSPRRPIVIKGTNSRSAAAIARRSARLSLADPPLHRRSVESSRHSVHSNEQSGDSRPSSRSSRHTTGRSSRENSQDVRFGGALSTLPESDSFPVEDFSPAFDYGSQRSQTRSDRAPSRSSHASTRISIGSTFANGFGATRKVDFEPRDPRTREELDAGSGSYLEVLLYSDPPPRVKSPPARWSSAAPSRTSISSKKAPISTPLIRSDSPPSITVSTPHTGKTSNNNFAQKLFGGFRGKSAQSQEKKKKRPTSMLVASSNRPEQAKPRPIVSGPLELEKAELERKQQQSRRDATPTSPQNLSVSFAPPITVMKSYTSLSRAYEQGGDVQEHRLPRTGSRSSFDTVERPAPRPFSLPPGLVTSQSSSDLPPVPPAPMKPPRSPLRPAVNPGNELLQPNSPRAISPVLSFKSFQSQHPSIKSETARSTTSTSEPIGVRDVMRGQFLER